MLIGNHYVSIDYLSTLIRNISKLQHGLVIFDIFPRDRQNFSSCVKICSDDVISCLPNIDDSARIIMYLHLVRSIMTVHQKINNHHQSTLSCMVLCFYLSFVVYLI